MSDRASNTDLLADLARKTRWSGRVGVGAWALTAVWAFWPVSLPVPIDTEATPAAAQSGPSLQSPLLLDLAAFDAPVWVLPPAPEAPVVAAPPPPPPPFKLQLLGVSVEVTPNGPVYRAVLYDPDSDAIRVVAAGESVAGRQVTSVTSCEVSLLLGNSHAKLALRPDHTSVPAQSGGVP